MKSEGILVITSEDAKIETVSGSMHLYKWPTNFLSLATVFSAKKHIYTIFCTYFLKKMDGPHSLCGSKVMKLLSLGFNCVREFSAAVFFMILYQFDFIESSFYILLTYDYSRFTQR